MKNNIKALIIILVIFIFSNELMSQNRISSPYSRYGIGSLQNRNTLTISSMGGLNKAVSDPLIINPGNPASYSAIDTLSFLFDGALIVSNANLSSTNVSQSTNYVSLSYFTIGFPIHRKWKTSIGLLPYSEIGYKIYDNQTLENIGNTTFKYEGDGGLTQMYWGNSFQLLSNLSIGINASYIFGNLIRTRHIEFESENTFNTLNKVTNQIGGFLFQAGLMHKIDIKEKYYLQTGLTYGIKSSLKSTDDFFSATYTLNSSEEVLMKDTIENFENQNGKIQIPMAIGGGIVFGKIDNFMFGIDAEWQKWEEFRFFGESDSLKNSLTLSAGGMYTPSANSSSFFKRTKYSAGFRYQQSALELKNTPINDMAVSLGIGIPILRSKNHLNIGIEVGQLGTINNDLIKINYFRFQIGMQFYERWFHRRKFD
ncbi:MAG: hypothetical protein PHY85_01465 [Bacteroidales bacterium]|nr:hypothetical protein [Bacteroidales bacterium]